MYINLVVGGEYTNSDVPFKNRSVTAAYSFHESDPEF